jgi:hypothetical protein
MSLPAGDKGPPLEWLKAKLHGDALQAALVEAARASVTLRKIVRPVTVAAL